jgi:hypothetical protein
LTNAVIAPTWANIKGISHNNRLLRLRSISGYNSERKLCASEAGVDSLASRVSYGSNPEHKRHPGDFGLTPPAAHCRAGADHE